MKVIKSIFTRSFCLELIEESSGVYFVTWDTDEGPQRTVTMRDLNQALNIFEDMLVIVEGH